MEHTGRGGGGAALVSSIVYAVAIEFEGFRLVWYSIKIRRQIYRLISV
jgi:hypothetical protein